MATASGNAGSVRDGPGMPLRDIEGESGGQGGIRTHGTLARTPHFECGAFNHSTTCPPAVIREPGVQGKIFWRPIWGPWHEGLATSAARPSSRRSSLKTVRWTVLFAIDKPRPTLSACGDMGRHCGWQVVSWIGLFIVLSRRNRGENSTPNKDTFDEQTRSGNQSGPKWPAVVHVTNSVVGPRRGMVR
jgi:hypothetical protein